jgi:hypothetical protein
MENRHNFVIVIQDDKTTIPVVVQGSPDNGYSCRNFVPEIDDHLLSVPVDLRS